MTNRAEQVQDAQDTQGRLLTLAAGAGDSKAPGRSRRAGVLQAIHDYAVSSRKHVANCPKTGRKPSQCCACVAPRSMSAATNGTQATCGAYPLIAYHWSTLRLVLLGLWPYALGMVLGLLLVLVGMMIGLALLAVLLAGSLAFSRGQIPPVRGGITPQTTGLASGIGCPRPGPNF